MGIPERVTVYGGGRMGAGIAHAFLVAGSRVCVVETASRAAEDARAKIMAGVQRADQEGHLRHPVATTTDRLVVASSLDAGAGADLVIEAVPEDVELKVEVLRRAERVSPQAWLGTNTSALSISEIAATLEHPERLVGLHFFNPVPTSLLVEVVVGDVTSADLVEEAVSWVGVLGKQPITVRDSPGFASSRLGVLLALEAVRMLEEGVASATDIDAAMVLGYKHPTGPLRTTDLVGLDVRLAIAENLEREIGPQFRVPRLLREKVKAGELGRKSGQGFFAW